MGSNISCISLDEPIAVAQLINNGVINCYSCETDLQEKDKQPEQDDSEKEQPSPPQQTELSPEQVKSLLEAMSNQEKKVQDKVNAEKIQGTPVRGQKDW